MKKKYFLFLSLVLLLLAGAWGLMVSKVEQPKYSVVEQQGSIEIRDYGAMIVAEAQVTGERKTAINKGFRVIADYIFGNNISSKKVDMTAPVTQQASEKIAMTAPVTQQASEKIAMTAPVTQQDTGADNWTVHFVMPSKHTMKTLPSPKNNAVKLKEIPAKRYAVIRFSGTANQKRLDKERKKLEDFIAKKDLNPQGEAIYAFYNPPWTLPFMRRNEVMIEIEK